jgi:kynureninase
MSDAPPTPFQRSRQQFLIEPGAHYLNGHSLSPPCKAALDAMQATLGDWQRRRIDGWGHPDCDWLNLPQRLGALMAPLVGAHADEVTLADSTTVNLHQLVATLFTPTAARNKLVVDAGSFPSDLYALASHLRLRGLDPETHLIVIPPGPDGLMREDDLIAALARPDAACAVLSSVVFATAQLLDTGRLARAAQQHGVKLILDCSHSAGAVPHRLHDAGVDGAVWCTYKYLANGPGAPAALFLHRKHHALPPGLAGWFGVDRAAMFQMRPTFDPAPGVTRLQIGTPHVLALAPMLGTLPLLAEIGIDAIRARSLELTSRLMSLTDDRLARHGVSIVTPREPSRRGGHVALRHPQAKSLCAALRERQIVGDFRNPDVLRLCPHPLFCDEHDIDAAVSAIEDLLGRSTLSGDGRTM